jgi:hypothetical protein
MGTCNGFSFRLPRSRFHGYPPFVAPSNKPCLRLGKAFSPCYRYSIFKDRIDSERVASERLSIPLWRPSLGDTGEIKGYGVTRQDVKQSILGFWRKGMRTRARDNKVCKRFLRQRKFF